MTDKRWTPGPWEWIGTNIEAPSGDVLSVETKCMAYCYGGYPVKEITEADKALIRAAPDMADALEAAEAALSQALIDPDVSEIAAALATVRAAMGRARGEGGAAEALVQLLVSRRYAHTSEEELQDAIADILGAAGAPFLREANLGDDRPDFLVGDVAIEVKIRGSRAQVIRQLARYARHSAVRSIVLATTRRQHAMPHAVGGKIVRVAYLGSL